MIIIIICDGFGYFTWFKFQFSLVHETIKLGFGQHFLVSSVVHVKKQTRLKGGVAKLHDKARSLNLTDNKSLLRAPTKAFWMLS